MSNSINLTNNSNSSNSSPIVSQLPQTSLCDLPIEMITQILIRLSSRDIGSCSQVCKQLNQVLQQNDTIWANLFYRHFPHVDSTQITNFQAAYQLLYSNLTKGVYASRTLQGHTGPVFALEILGEQLISSSDDNTIKIWDLKTNTCTSTLQGHAGGITALKILGKQLISGSYDKMIKIWDLKTNTCTSTLQGHTSGVTAFEILGEQLISGSYDNTIKIWDLKTNTCTSTLQGHAVGVIALKIFGKQLISSPSNGTIKIWDFGANHEMIFNEIAGLLETGDKEKIQQAMDRFSKMPEQAKNQIYAKLYKILEPFANDYWGCAEHAFWGIHGQTSTPLQRAQAIKDYLNEEVLKTG